MSNIVQDQVVDELMDLLTGDNPSEGAIKKAQDLIEKYDLGFTIEMLRRLVNESY